MPRARPPQNPPVTPSRFVQAWGAEQVRVRADRKAGHPIVRLDLLQQLASHTTALTVIGRPYLLSVDAVDELVAALTTARREALGLPVEPEPPAKRVPAEDF